MIYHREPICKMEHILTHNLSICKSKGHCEYLHPYNNVRYCKKYKCIQDAMYEFNKEKELIEKKVIGDRLI